MKSDENNYQGIAALQMTILLKPKQFIVGCFLVIMVLIQKCLKKTEDISYLALGQLIYRVFLPNQSPNAMTNE